MKIELTGEQSQFLTTVLTKEFEETRVEIHHARNYEYKLILKEREKLIRDLLKRFKKAGRSP